MSKGFLNSSESVAVLSLENFKSHRFIEDGKHHISMGDLDLAIDCFQKSIETLPTAEAYTYLGWVLSLKDELDIAIELCEKAIELNPNFANPVNDIGHYLIQKGKLEEAIPWLERAKKFPNYDTPHFPYINLGRIFSSMGMYKEALTEFKEALKLSPGHKEVQKVILELEEINHNA